MTEVLKEASLGFYTILAFIGAIGLTSATMYIILYVCCNAFGWSPLEFVIWVSFAGFISLASKHGAYALGQHGARRRMLLVMLMTMSVFLFGAIVGIYFGELETLATLPGAYAANILLKHYYLQGVGIKAPPKQLIRWWEIP